MSKKRRRSKFHIDKVAEDLIIRLSTLEVGSNDHWKTTAAIICDRLTKNMEPKPKVAEDELPKMLFSDKATRASDDIRGENQF